METYQIWIVKEDGEIVEVSLSTKKNCEMMLKNGLLDADAILVKEFRKSTWEEAKEVKEKYMVNYKL